MNETKKDWITKIVPSLAFAAGIIMAAVGGSILISSSLKLSMFEAEPYALITQEECTYDYHSPVMQDSPVNSPKVRAEAEIQACLERRKQEERTRFQNSKKDNMVDGISVLVVGAILLLAFRKRK